MARARNIKPGFFKNEDLAECSIWARYIFPGLWMLADREGRLEDRPKRIKGELLPFDSQEVEPLLAELASRKDAQGVPFIIRYQNSDGRFIQISKFSIHQTPHYSEKQSIIKPQNFSECSIHEEGEFLERSENNGSIKRGSQPPDSLNPDSLNPESTPTPKKTARFDSASIEIPSGLKPEKWSEWISYRKMRRLSMTEATARKQVKFLEDCIGKGFNPSEIIDNSITNGWQGLFEPKSRGSPGVDAAKERAHVGDVLTGRSRNERTTASNNAIDGTAVRVA